MEMIYCACGCGQEITRKPRPGRLNKFIHGHSRKGLIMSEDQKRKIGISNSRPMSKKQKRLLSKIKTEGFASGKYTPYWKGKKMRPDIIEKMHNATRGKPGWKKGQGRGRFVGNRGYVFIYIPNLPVGSKNYILEHRFIMAQHIGRELYPTEDVHHINGDKTNNSIDNLILFPSRSAHLKFHHSKS